MSLTQGTVLNVEDQKSIMTKDFNNPNGPKKPNTLTTFVLKKEDGTELRCRKWGAWNNEYIAQVITFDCQPDSKDPGVMTVKGKISCENVKSAPSSYKPAAPLPSPSPAPVEPVKTEDLEELFGKAIPVAEALSKKYLKVGAKLAGEGATPEQTVMFAGMFKDVVATLVIQMSKQSNIQAMNKRYGR